MTQLEAKIVKSNNYIHYTKLYPHENVVIKRKNKLVKYIKSIEDYIVIPSIIACKDTNVIIDGHHRYFALIELGIYLIPTTFIDYNSKNIHTHTNSKLITQKNHIIESALNRKLLKPKSTKHVIFSKNEVFPLIILSKLCKVKK